MDKNKYLLSTGELANMAGVSVRTLQYYDEQGLLIPCITEGGRRRYTRENVLRLEQILFLKSCGFSLEEIKDKILDLKTAFDFRKTFSQQKKVLTDQIENLNHTVKMLDMAIAETANGEEINMDRMTTIMESMKRGNPYTFVVRYFDDEQVKNYAFRLIGAPNSMDYVKDIFDCMEQLYKMHADPAGEEGQELAKRWWSMANQFTEGDVKLLKSLIYVGRDIQNWPDEVEEVKKPIENFLAKALKIYFDNHGIEIGDVESKS
jgi:Predicted transcriptional regulators